MEKSYKMQLIVLYTIIQQYDKPVFFAELVYWLFGQKDVPHFLKKVISTKEKAFLHHQKRFSQEKKVTKKREKIGFSTHRISTTWHFKFTKLEYIII